MAPKGRPRDMNEWRETLRDPNIRFPGESGEYRRARNQLLEAEDELRRLNEQVAAQRRALPAGGLLAEDYVFESAADGSEVRFSDLFAPGKDTLVIYHMMFPRWSKDPRAGAPGGKTALLPVAEQPCPRLAQSAAAVLAQQHLQPRLSRGNSRLPLAAVRIDAILGSRLRLRPTACRPDPSRRTFVHRQFRRAPGRAHARLP